MTQETVGFQWFNHPDIYQMKISLENISPKTLIVTKMAFTSDGGDPWALKCTETYKFQQPTIIVDNEVPYNVRCHDTDNLEQDKTFILPNKETVMGLQEYGRRHGILKHSEGYMNNMKEMNYEKMFISKATHNPYHLVFD